MARLFPTHTRFVARCCLVLGCLATYVTAANASPAATDGVDGSATDTMTVDKLPEVTHRVAPDYPAQLARQGIEGTVVLDCLLSDSGTVDSVAVVKGIHPLLDSSAAAALRSFRFSPALSGGKPVPVLVQYALPFSLSEIAAGIPQYVTIQGTLKESGTRTPIPNAMVVAAFPDSTADTGLSIPFSRYLAAIGAFGNQRFEAGKLVTTTDSLGKFRFLSLPACSVVITSPLPGYESISERELIRKGEALTLTYYSQRMSYNNFEIVVYGKTEEKEVARHQLTLAETRKIPGLGNDAVRVIQAMPGVSRPSFGSGDIIVRGQPNWDSKFFLDGTEIPLIYHFGGLKSIYNPDALKSVDFYPGGWGCRYGGATAGIIEIKGRPAKSDRWHGQLDLNLIDGACFAEGPLMKNISMLVSARRGFLGDFASWYFKKYPDQFPFSLAPYYSDILVRGDISLSKNNTCFVTLLHNRDSLGIFVPSVQGGSSEIGGSTNALGVSIRFTTGQIGLSTRISPKLSNELRYALTVYGYTQTMFGFASADQRSYLHHFRDDMTYAPNEWMQLSAGTDINLMLLDLALEITSGKGIVNRDTTNNWLFGVVGAYVQLTIKPTDALELSPGLRYDYFPELIHHGAIVPEFWNYHWINNHQGPSAEPSLRISGRYRLRENHTVKAAVGNYSQTPQPMGQVIHKTWGDPSLPTTKAAQCIAGYECRLTDLINADLQCYYNRQWDIPREATPEDLAKNPDALWLRDGKGRMRGLELMLRHENNGRFFGWLSYTLARSERWNHKEKKYSLFSDDETHNIQLMASRHLKHEWDVGCRVRYVTGKPTTPVIDVVENEPYNYFEPIYGAENSTRMDPFFQIDVRIDKKFVYRTWMLSLYCDVQNLSWLFYKSPEMVVWNYDYTAKQNVSNIIQPALGFKAEF